jgi:hypothetical protein
MATFNLSRFSRPEMLRKIDRNHLLLFLQPYAEYFSTRGLNLPPPESSNGLDYKALSLALANPDPSANPDLFDALYLVHELSTPEAFDSVQEALQDQEFEEEIPSDLSPADLAIRVYLSNPDILDRVHARQELRRPRSFVYFQSQDQTNGGIKLPGDDQITNIEEELNKGLVRKRRGKTAKVIPFNGGDNLWFLIRRGAVFNRQGIIRNDGESDSLYYRPERYDTVVYNNANNEIRMNVRNSSKWLLELYRCVFGHMLFGNMDYFKGRNKFTLEPLRQDGRACLECGDVDGIENVTLTEYTIFYDPNFNESVTRRADDVFGLLEARQQKFPKGGHLIRAKFKIKFTGAKYPRSVTIKKGNCAGFKIDDDSVAIEQWLTNRGFITEIANA